MVSTSTQPFSSSRLRVPHLGAERGNHDHVAGVQARHLLLGRLGRDDLDAHVADLVVDFRVVDDFAQQINGFVGREILARGIGQINGAFHAVTKAEFLGQLHRQTVRGEHAAIGADPFHEFTAVVRQHLGLHRFENVRAAKVDLFLRGEALRLT